MMEALFGNAVVEKVLFTILVYGEAYASSLARTFTTPVNGFQQQLRRLENGGIIVSRLVGKTRIYTLNPGYAFRGELEALLKKAFEFVPEKEKDAYYKKRTRPRKAGKPL